MLLDGFYLRRTHAFEQWLDRWRDRLARRHLAVLEALADTAELQGDFEQCLGYRRELTEREPCSGPRTLALMRSLTAAGSADGAIRCSRAYALMIREDYGLEPDPAVLAWADSLQKQTGPS
jgi:DNA-binding SARP family transcriptional activator